MPNSAVTRQSIAESFKLLILEMPFHKITVSLICEETGISRRSFYNHFKDIHDVVIWIFNTEFLDQYLQTSNISFFDSYLPAFCNYISGQKDYYYRIFLLDGQNSLKEYLEIRLKELFIEDVKEGIKNEKIATVFIGFISDIFIVALLDWIHSKSDQPPLAFVHKFRSVCASAGYNFANYASGKKG